MTGLATGARARGARTDSRPARAGGSPVQGTGAMLRLALRRDRVTLPVWILVFVFSAYGSAAATVGLYPTVSSRVAAAETSNATPAIVALYGRIHDATDIGGLATIKLTVLGSVLVAVLMILTVNRHTRAEEEAGRTELLRAGVLGRSAPLAAALVEAVLASLVLGALTALGLIAAGLDPAGSVAFGLVWCLVGMAFAAVAALAAQVTQSARSATGLSMTVLALAFVLRALGDTGEGSWRAALSWLSPLGWGQQLRPFADERWWVAVLPLAFTAVCAVGAHLLVGVRDLGAGLVAPRPGPARAVPSLRSPLALAGRLQRGALVGWWTGFVLLGLILGGIASSVGGMLDSEQARDMITKMGGVDGLTDAFLGTELGVAGLLAAAFGIAATLRLRSEENALRAEPLLAASVTRTSYAVSHLTLGLLGSALLLVSVGAAAGLTYGASTGDVGGAVVHLVGAALVRLPAVWLLTGLAVALFGLVPRLVGLAWCALAASMLLGEFGEVLGLPEWARRLSPFSHVPALPGGEMAWGPLVVLLAVAAVLVLAGVAGFRRRDLG